MFQPVHPVDPLAELKQYFVNNQASLVDLRSLQDFLQQYFVSLESARRFMSEDLRDRFGPYFGSTHHVLYTEARLADTLAFILKNFFSSEKWQNELIILLDHAVYTGLKKNLGLPTIKTTIKEAWSTYNYDFPKRANQLGAFKDIPWAKGPYRTLESVIASYRSYLSISLVLFDLSQVLTSYPQPCWWRPNLTINWTDFEAKMRAQQLSSSQPINFDDCVNIEMQRV